MEYLDGKINHLVVEPESKKKIFVKTFDTRVTGAATKKSEKIFGLFEIESKHPKIPELVDLVIEEIKNNYYRPKGLEDHSFSGPAEKFEWVLKKANLAFASFIESQHIELDIKKINIIIGLSTERDIHLSFVGNIGALLFYFTGKNTYKIINITDTSDVINSEPDPLKIFSQVISGHVRLRDVLFISTASIFDYFSLERIKNILTQENVTEGLIELRDLINTSGSLQSFAALTLELTKKITTAPKVEEIASFDYTRAASQDSIKELIKTERETAKLLTPSLMPEVKKYLESFGQAFNNYSRRIKNNSDVIYQKQKKSFKSKLPGLPKIPTPEPLNQNIKKVRKIGGVTFKVAAESSVNSIQNARKKISKHPLWNNFSFYVKNFKNKLAKKFSQLPIKSKVIFVGIIILGLIFSYSVIWLGIKNSKEQRISKINETIVAAENKQNEATASLIFRDENLARQLLIDAKNSLTDLVGTTKDQQAQIQNLISSIENNLQELRHVVNIPDPVQVVNFQNLDSNAVIASLATKRRNTIYTQNTKNQAIYKANTDTRVLASIFAPDSDIGNFKIATTLSDNELIFFNQNNEVIRLNPNNDALDRLTIDLPAGNPIAATTFNNRLYVLDPPSNQIYRFNRSNTGFASRSNWLNNNINLSDAVSLAVDGSIYVLRSSGQVQRFDEGNLSDFSLTAIDPALVNPTQIKTVDNSNFIYILDPGSKRLLVTNKEGKLINQYTSERFDDLKDFVVDEAAKSIYLLNGTAVFGVPAQHLN